MMPTPNQESISQTQPEEDYQAKLGRINTLVEGARSKRTTYISKQLENFKTRRCLFDHPDKKTDPNAFPWMGASDQKVYTVDTEIRRGKALKVNALFKSRLSFEPQGKTPTERAKNVEEYWHWNFFHKVRPRREAIILADMLEEKGLAFLFIPWVYETQTIDEPVAQETWAPEELQALKDPNVLEETVMPIVQQRYPKAKPEQIIKGIQDLRAGVDPENIKLPKLVYTKQQAEYIALSPDRDLVFPEYTDDIQDADWIARMHNYTRSGLKKDAYSLGYDKKVVDHLCDTFFDVEGRPIATAKRSTPDGTSLKSQQDSEFGIMSEEGLPVVDFFEREWLDDGSCRIVVTTFASCYMDKPLRKTIPLNYGHGFYPFVAFELDPGQRSIYASRGKAEILKPIQDELKIQKDSRIDRTTMATLPPIEHPLGQPPSEMGPGAQVGYVSKRGETGFFEIPKFDPGSDRVEGGLRADIQDYYGTMNSGASHTGSVTPISADQSAQVGEMNGLLTEYDLENWFAGWERAIAQGFALTQQFLKGDVWFRAMGDPNAYPIRVSAEEIAGAYDIVPIISVQDLSPSKSMEAATQFLQAATTDQTGTLDPGQAYIEWATRLNMKMAKKILRPGVAAQQAEINAVEDDIVKIKSGIPKQAPMKSNAQFRLQYLQQYVSQPDVQQAIKNDPAFGDRMVAYIKQYEMQIQQQQNAQIGRQGAIVQ
jgi:hypothetical protein